ncbi:DNA-binding response regulator [Caballeronia sp. LjRoot34]|uniref:response regulator transcription factor n=1 Tax=Caballeronia sp. LjRoot34 TaxID=3342325 RepID=UPI003ECE9C0B
MTECATALPTTHLHGLRVLIVDDNDEDRMLLTDFLSQQGCRVYIAKDGRDGCRKAQTVLPDLILMDVAMPIRNGLAACRLLKAHQATRLIPLIFLTTAALPRERVEGLTAGAVDYVTKPFDFEEVRLRLSIHLKVDLDVKGNQFEDAPLDAAADVLDTMLFRATRKLLLEHLHETPELAVLAESVGCHSRRLTLAFRRCVGVTMFDFLREERMKEARRLLSDTAVDVHTIATTLGFSSTGNFSTAFRERFGLSPSSLRQSQEGRA